MLYLCYTTVVTKPARCESQKASGDEHPARQIGWKLKCSAVLWGTTKKNRPAGNRGVSSKFAVMRLFNFASDQRITTAPSVFC